MSSISGFMGLIRGVLSDMLANITIMTAAQDHIIRHASQ
jgi:hypothetical protein